MNSAREIYEKLWRETQPLFERGEARLDLHLLDKLQDKRRGLSLAFRPSPTVQAHVENFLRGVAREFPNQYFYQPVEWHVTLLTLISATEFWQKEAEDVPEFQRLLREILNRHRSFKINFCGITAAPNAVLIQGFPLDNILAEIRADIRSKFAPAGFAARLDRRYINQAAHMTVMRFCRADANWSRLAEVIRENRQTPFGVTEVNSFELVLSDWYASADSARILEKYFLANDGAQIS